MEFGIFAQLFVPRFERDIDPAAEHKRIMRNVDISLAAERAGLKYVWCPEHHFLDEYSHMPGPEVFLTYVGAQTERIHLGSAIFNLTPPVNKPARVAETVALMDHLLDNRFEFGTGRGSSTTEVFGFDIDDLALTKEMWRETITEIPKMWKDGKYSYEGKFFRMPEREVFPKPHGPAHPAMWVAAGSPPTFGEAGSLGLGAFCFSEGSPREIEPLVKNYKNAIAGATPVGDYVNDNIMAVTNLVCMEDRNEAFRSAADMKMNYYTSLMHHWLDNIPTPEGFPKWPDILPEPTPEQIEKATTAGYAVVGDPDDCAKAIQLWADIGVDQLTFSPTTNTLPTETVIASMELFGKEVLPQFDKDPVHSTTKYREAASRAVTLPDEFVELAARVSNWGRWGDDDEIGTLNLIDGEAVRRGAAAVRTGKRFSLAVRLDQHSPQIGSIPGRINPLHAMVAINTQYQGTLDGFCTSDDIVTMGLQAATHWDALGHVSYGGKLYNGFPASSITAETGATRCGISRIPTLVSRGVLLDVARALGRERLEGGYGITPTALDTALALGGDGLTIEPGDVVLVRTGNMQLFKSRDRQTYTAGSQPGLTMATAQWFRDRDVAAVATDTVSFEVYPGERDDVLFPVHLLHLRDMGLTQGQNFDLEALSVDCTTDGVYQFLLEASPLPFTGAVGSPVNPVAIK